MFENEEPSLKTDQSFNSSYSPRHASQNVGHSFYYCLFSWRFFNICSFL